MVFDRARRALADWIAPEDPRRRAAARVRPLLSPARQRFDAAQHSRRTIGWTGAFGDAATDLPGGDLELLRARHREFCGNNPLANRAPCVLAQNVIGTGMRPRPLTKNPAERRAWRELWKSWASSRHCDVGGKLNAYGLQDLLVRTIAVSGEVLIRYLPTTPRRGLAVPLQVQLLEPDRLSTDTSSTLEGGAKIVQGVEFSARGERKAFHVWRDHPGALEPWTALSLDPVRVPISQMDHAFRVLRPEQVRGIPRGASCLFTSRDFDAFLDALILQQTAAGTQVAFIEPPLELPGSSSDEPAWGNPTEDQETATSDVEQMIAGTITRLRRGEKVHTNTTPQPVGVEEFGRLTSRQIAAGWGLSYEALTGDYSVVNFASGRMGWLEMGRELDHWRAHVVVTQFLDRLWQEFALAAILANVAPSSQMVGVAWDSPGRAMIKPSEDVQVSIESIQAGLSSRQRELRARGLDYEEILEEIREDEEAARAAGVMLDAIAAEERTGGPPPPEGDDPDEAEGDPDPGEDGEPREDDERTRAA